MILSVVQYYGIIKCIFIVSKPREENQAMPVLSIVVPCFNEEETIPVFYEAVCSIQDQIDAELEFCFIDDGSRDASLSILKELRARDSRVHYLSLSRNFGKEAGMLAGLDYVHGDFVVTMDVDLQDPPELLPEMYAVLADPGQDYDAVATRRSDRSGEPVIRSFLARRFYQIINCFSSVEIAEGSRDFRMMKRNVVNAVISDREYNRFSKGIYNWVGFKTKWMEFPNAERTAGATKWPFRSLLSYAAEGIMAYSTFPLVLGIFTGFLLCAGSLAAFLYELFRDLLFHQTVRTGFCFVCLILFCTSMILLTLGILGLYISRIYLETKRRPIYIIREKE